MNDLTAIYRKYPEAQTYMEELQALPWWVRQQLAPHLMGPVSNILVQAAASYGVACFVINHEADVVAAADKLAEAAAKKIEGLKAFIKSR